MLLTALSFAALAAQTFTLTPSDDIWVYPHASDPAGDTMIRVWGVGGKPAPSGASDAEDFSMGYLKWSLVGTPVGGKLKEARLILTQLAKPGFTLEQAKLMPLEARPLRAGFGEAAWKTDMVQQFLPRGGKEDAYGSGAPETLQGEFLSITIDLLKGKGGFADALAKAQADPKKEFAIALTSSMDMAELGRSSIYKIYTKEERDEKLRPRLVLVFE
jgi:hypothetical protein